MDFDSRRSTDPTPTRRSSEPDPLVFLAEDDDALRALLREAFVRQGYRIEEGRSGRELVTLVEGPMKSPRQWPNLIVSDIVMPGLGGFGLVRRLRQLGLDAPVVLITSFAEERTLHEASEMGAVAVFSKPFEIDDLLTAAECFGRPGEGRRPRRR